MKWPWVSRARLEDYRALAAQRLTDADCAWAKLDEARKRIDELTGEIIRMRREGFVPQPEPPTPEATVGLPAAVQDAIEERSASAAMRRQLRNVAERMLRDDQEETAVIEAILEGESFDEEYV